MKKFLTLIAFLGTFAAVNAQTDAVEPVKDAAVSTEKAVDAVKEEAVKGDATMEAVKEEATDMKEAAKADGKEVPACCAGKAKGAKCDHAKAEAGHGDGHGHAEGMGHDHASAKAHVCNKECKGDAHALACGEEGHKCSADCHAKK